MAVYFLSQIIIDIFVILLSSLSFVPLTAQVSIIAS